jgi:hypothetical protein
VTESAEGGTLEVARIQVRAGGPQRSHQRVLCAVASKVGAERELRSSGPDNLEIRGDQAGVSAVPTLVPAVRIFWAVAPQAIGDL